MADTTFLDWPFFDDAHRAFARDLDAWCTQHLGAVDHDADVDATCRDLVRELGDAGWLRATVPAAFGGTFAQVDSRAVCIARETLARHDALADFAFAMQGLGSAPIVLADNAAMQQRWLPPICAGSALAAFALSEKDAGSDVAAIATTARLEGDTWIIDGEKTWISNGGIADVYVVFARTGEAPGNRGLSAFVVAADTPGLTIADRIELIAPHPLATLRFANCRIPRANLLGVLGEGFKLAMRSLDVFRAGVAAAALGLARRALDASLAYSKERAMFGSRLADFQLSHAAFAEMATTIDASALLTYRAAWTRDVRQTSTTREAAMAKWHATESAQRVIDRAVQFHGALGVTRGSIPERLYRDIRALRIYEGASEVQQLIIARETLR